MRVLITILAASLLAGGPSRVQAKAAVASLPDHFGHWTASGPAAKVTAPANNGTGAVNSGVSDEQVSAEAGLTAAQKRTYSDGSNEITLTLAEFKDPSGAYQGYTAALKTGMKQATVGPPSAVDATELVAQAGNLVVTVSDPLQVSDPDLKLLVSALREHADTTPLPPMRDFLPESEMVEGTHRYALGPAGFQNAMAALQQPTAGGLASELGFASGAEVMAAQYGNSAQHGILVLIDYPTPQLAEQHLRHLQGPLSTIAKSGDATIERKGSLLSIVLGPSSADYAKHLRNAIRYGTQVTWNEPHQTLTDPPITSMIAQIIIATFFLMMAAVVLGIAFGGLRVVTKVFFPGKVFDRPDRMEVLQLGLNSKRIDPRDLY